MAVTFDATIKPYFTECYRQHMLDYDPNFDLWDKATVQKRWQDIYNRCSIPAGQPGSMPADGCPEGVWDATKREQFLKDFQDWKDGGYQ